MEYELKYEVVTLACARSVEAECKAEVDAAQAFLEASFAWENLEQQRELLKTAKDHVAIAETATREAAMGIFAETGDKAPHPAVKVKDFVVLDYDTDDAIEYALAHLPKALKFIKKVFEKAAKVVAMDFVAILQEPRATIARDLSKYLPEN
jgi:Ni,Fe-hydrogenase I large subunit